MLGMMLKPFFKKFIGIFFSMSFVATLAIGLLVSFASSNYNLRTTFKSYLEDYEDVDSVVSYNFAEKETTADVVNVEGVDSVEYRVATDLYLQKENGRTITSRVLTFKDDGTSLFNRYVVEKLNPLADKLNVSIVRKFAKNNDLKVGDTIKLGYFDFFLEFYINEIIECPEAIQVRANNYVWSDNTDFGYVYIAESELNKAVYELATLLETKLTENEAFRAIYNRVVNAVGSTFPDLVQQVFDRGNYTAKYANQMLVKAKEGYTQEEVTSNVKNYFASKRIGVKSAIENHNMFYYIYMESAIKQVSVATVFLPVFFFSVTMIVVGLFTNQIIKAMTPQIGVMMSIGVGKMDIISLFLMFSLIMSFVAGLLGSIVGFGLNVLLASTMIEVYSLPTIPFSANVVIVITSILALAVFSQITTLISCQRIFKITPKDATISNEAARRNLPEGLKNLIESAPMNLKLSLNAIAQNPRRFFVSTFSIFASFIIIILSLFFGVSKTELMHQTLDVRWVFDAQVYMTDVADNDLINDVKSNDSVKDFLDCYYTYAEITTFDGKESTFLECLAYDETVESNLVVIPEESGRGNLKIQKNGVILPKTTAELLGVKKGDTVVINGVPVMISDISAQYFHPLTYMSKYQMDAIGVDYISTFLVNVNDENAFLDYMSKKNASLTVFTEALRKDVEATYNSIDVFIYILIGFSLFMGFIILSIMSQNALLEQKRQLSVLRLIGFRIMDVSHVWTIESITHLVLASLFAIPLGTLAALILFKLSSSITLVYPLIFDFIMVLFTFLFILAIIVTSHLISMFSIYRWNLADNTRSRE